MSADEVWWRVVHKAREAAGRCLAPLRQHPKPPTRILSRVCTGQIVREGLIGEHLRAANWTADGLAADQWREALAKDADNIAAHRLNLFDLEQVDLGREIDWNYEHKAGKKAPMGYAASIDYRDYEATGDCKFVWEPNRHHQLVVLGRAYRLTGEVRYAATAAELLDSWLRQCPYGMGMNWRSPLELAIRLINWVWTLELIHPAGVISEDLDRRLRESAYQHLREVSRNYSRYSSANNHLIGEAAGVFIGSSYFAGLKGADRLRSEAHNILAGEILEQTFSDGGNREQAIGYHLFVLQFFLLAGLVARNNERNFEPAYWDRLERMFEFTANLQDGGANLPMIGDCDDGYVLDLGGRKDIVLSYLVVGAILFGRADFKARTGAFSEPAFWLLGPEGRDCFDRIEVNDASGRIGSKAFPQSGYYLLQRGHRDAPDRTSVVFDCGDLGFKSIAAHGHADALSLTLRAFGVDVLVDPGTYDYFTYGGWRDYFRSTRAHNTIVIDELDQSQMLGSFMWGRRANATCAAFRPTDGGGTIVAEHDGYRRLKDPVIHRRTVTLEDNEPAVIVRDEIIAKGRHRVQAFWHLAEQCTIKGMEGNEFAVDCGAGRLTMTLDPRLSVTAVRGGEDPIIGWVSRGYHRKAASTTLAGSCTAHGNLSLTTRIRIET